MESLMSYFSYNQLKLFEWGFIKIKLYLQQNAWYEKQISDKSTTFNELKYVNLNRTSLIFFGNSLSIV